VEPQLTLLPKRRVSIDQDGRPMPLVPHLPLLSSANQPWEGFLLEPLGAAARLRMKRSKLQSHMQKLGIRISRTGA
jgi:hypothetical protein